MPGPVQNHHRKKSTEAPTSTIPRGSIFFIATGKKQGENACLRSRSNHAAHSSIASTCNSTASDWLEVKDEILGLTHLNEMEIDVIVPSYLPPSHYKRDQITAEVLRQTGKEYYDDNVEFEGLYVDYAEEIKRISQGDIQDLHFTYRSKGSSESYPGSSFTAAVLDVANGLADMAIG